ncbi:alpha/beta fold hydrolase [bacterium RCC_150]
MTAPSLAWTEEGSGEPLLLVAGKAPGMAGWDPVVANLARSFRVIWFDHRGIGASAEGAPERYITRAFAADAVAGHDAAANCSPLRAFDGWSLSS